ncbi:MAG: 50S ribosomal protein L4 [Candidatus Omnitrophota bacterium]|nr:MAG: 50S ribosomal protein L4 [Candidatus Omnitrophota bacterium]
MKEIPVYNMEGKKVDTQTLPDDLFKEAINKNVLYYYVVAYLANQRKGTASTKTRGEVSGGGKKPWRQKGTGRARVGSIRNPIWRHGGVVFGPKPRDYRIDLPKKVKRKAIKEALRDKFMEDKVAIIKLEKIEKPKTKIFANFLKVLGLQKEKVLFILSKEEDGDDKNIVKSLRNLPTVSYDYGDKINAYEILRNDRLIISENSFNLIKEYLEKNGV